MDGAPSVSKGKGKQRAEAAVPFSAMEDAPMNSTSVVDFETFNDIIKLVIDSASELPSGPTWAAAREIVNRFTKVEVVVRFS
jgi:hypothetical protein